MQLSVFNLYVEDYPEPGSTLVHNTFSGAYVVLDDETLRGLRKLDAGEALTDAERELVDDPDFVDPDVAILVDNREAEDKEFLDWFERRRSRTQTLEVIVSVNLACNFECPYCCQGEVLDGSVMRPDVAADTARWLAERAIEVGVGNVHLIFVGGEPLLHPSRIEAIANGVRQLIEPHGIELTLALITNGYFLGPEMLDRLVPLGLVMAQVTIDGDETTHSLTRVSKKGEDTFRRVFDNAVAASRRIQIQVNGNYQSNTISGFEPLLRKLADAGLAEGSPVRLTPALEGLSSEQGVGSGACTWSGSQMDSHMALQDSILKAGFERPRAHQVGPCTFHDRHSMAIDYDGTIQTCPGFLGHPEWGVGQVSTGLTEKYQRMLEVNPQHGCTGCSHRPNCGGGCIANEWMRSGNMEGVNCESDYFETVKDASLVREYVLETSADVATAIEQFPETRPAAPQGRRSSALRIIAA